MWQNYYPMIQKISGDENLVFANLKTVMLLDTSSTNFLSNKKGIAVEV